MPMVRQLIAAATETCPGNINLYIIISLLGRTALEELGHQKRRQ